MVATAAVLADTVRETLAGQDLSRVRVVVAGSTGERARCVEAGLQGLDDHTAVVVHDIVWPILGAGLLDRVVAALHQGAVAVMPATPVTDSVKTIDAAGVLTATVDREQLRTVQYPRGFDAATLAVLLKHSGSEPFDELEAVLSSGTPLTIVEGDDEAVSVELPRDTDYLAALIEGRHDLADRR